MLRTVLKTFSVMLATSALLAACGGGGSDAANVAANAVVQSGSNDAGAPQSGSGNTGSNGGNGAGQQDNTGVPFPTTVISSVFDGTDNSGQPLTILLQDDGSYFIVHSDSVNRKPTRVVLGTGTLGNGSFASPAGLDLNLLGIGGQVMNPVTLSASYTEKSKFNGSLSYAAENKTVSFSGDYNSAYARLPDLAAFAGIYVGSIANKDFREENIILMISADGKLSGHLICGCMISAQLRVQDDGTAYAATLDFKQGFHVLTGKSLGGNVYLDGKAERLYIVGKMTGTDDRVIFVGTKAASL